MELSRSPVRFDQEAHTYTLGGRPLSGITPVLERCLFPDKYAGVPEKVMQAAAEKGTLIHQQCELADELGIIPDQEDALNYIRIKQSAGLQTAASEYIVSDGENYASAIDKVFRESEDTFDLADIKTTSKPDLAYLAWQLSIYAYFFELQNPDAHVGRLLAIWLHGGKYSLIQIPRIPVTPVRALLAYNLNHEEGEPLPDEVLQYMQNNQQSAQAKSEKHAEQTEKSSVLLADDLMPQKYQALEAEIQNICKQIKYWKDKEAELKDGILKEMIKESAYSWKGEKISFTRRKESIRKSFDTAKFSEDYPELYQQYIKESPTAGSITIKI